MALPGLAASPTEPEKPAAQEAALTVNLEGSEGQDPYPLIVTASGRAPVGTTTLSDATGLHTATVTSTDDCRGAVRSAFPRATGRWCLELTDVAAGHELTGTVKRAGSATPPVADSALKLTVNRRADFLGWPIVVLLLGIAAGGIAAAWKPALKSPIRRSVLGDLVAKNARAGSDAIEGLRDFVRDRLAAGESVDATIDKVHPLTANGPKLAADARAALGTTIAKLVDQGKQLPNDHPLVRAARTEAARTTHRIADFFDGEGERVPHPAAELDAALGELAEYAVAIATLRADVDNLDATVRREPAIAAKRAQIVFDRMAERSDGTQVTAAISEARGAIDAATARQLVAAETVRRGAAAGYEPQPPLGLEAAELGGAELGATKLTAWLGTIGVIAVTLAFAVLTIWHETYEPNLTFSSFDDYFGLFAAAVGSGAAGAVVLWLGYWLPTSPGGTGEGE